MRLTLRKDEQVTLLQRGAEFGDFWLVKDARGKTGYVQADYIKAIAFNDSKFRNSVKKAELRGKVTSDFKGDGPGELPLPVDAEIVH